MEGRCRDPPGRGVRAIAREEHMENTCRGSYQIIRIYYICTVNGASFSNFTDGLETSRPALIEWVADPIIGPGKPCAKRWSMLVNSLIVEFILHPAAYRNRSHNYHQVPRLFEIHNRKKAKRISKLIAKLKNTLKRAGKR
ncbi:hypothetical protein LguiA_029829 [Lonicera macranthoides]